MSLFSQQDLHDIEAAVQAAEKKSSGEIVPYFVDASADYPEVFWKLLTYLNSTWTVAALAWFEYGNYWYDLGILEVILIGLTIGVLSTLLLVRIPFVIRLLADRDSVDRAVTSRAAEAFLSEEVFRTRDRSGILIFISELEHRVLIVGDSGINAKVKAGTWDSLVTDLIASIRQKKAAAGLIAAIDQCGTVLKEAGVTRRDDDTDELGNTLRKG
ncbi:MAG: TPM domain-containing protein [Bacteroidetes bacterium]|nr:TPM domain-containing protein [Bacteroidota bacterium]